MDKNDEGILIRIGEEKGKTGLAASLKGDGLMKDVLEGTVKEKKENRKTNQIIRWFKR